MRGPKVRSRRPRHVLSNLSDMEKSRPGRPGLAVDSLPASNSKAENRGGLWKRRAAQRSATTLGSAQRLPSFVPLIKSISFRPPAPSEGRKSCVFCVETAVPMATEINKRSPTSRPYVKGRSLRRTAESAGAGHRAQGKRSFTSCCLLPALPSDS